MATAPIIMRKGTRQAVITGTRISLQKLREKKGAVNTFPEADMPDVAARLNTAYLWVDKGFADLPDFKTPTRSYS